MILYKGRQVEDLDEIITLTELKANVFVRIDGSMKLMPATSLLRWSVARGNEP